MIRTLDRNRFLLLTAAFLLVLFYLLLTNKDLFMAAGLAAVFISTAVMAVPFSLTPMVLVLAAALPLSVKWGFAEGTLELIFPGELLEGWLIFVYAFRFFTGKQRLDKKLLYHPVILSLMAFIFFLVISVALSTMPVVSVKATIVKLVHFLIYFFLLYEVIGKKPERIIRVFTWYGLSLAVVTVYTLIRHAGFQFSKDTSGIVALPFYNDHTIYSACLALLFPLVAGSSFLPRTDQGSGFPRILYRLLALLFIAGIFFSLCRATWVSMTAGLMVGLLLLLKAKPVHLITGIIMLALLAFLNREMLIGSFRQNRYDSNARGADLEAQTKSITNISNDESNGERLNRWKCAIRMIGEKPWFGFGPGTYQFQYIPFQRSNERTRISVTDPYHIARGHGGTAHSEYLLVFSESGIFAFLTFLFILLYTLYRAILNFYAIQDKRLRMINAALLIGVVTYLVHGLFNNFLDTDKAAFLFWSSLLTLVVIDLHMKGKMTPTSGQ